MVGRSLTTDERTEIGRTFLSAYRFQYIVSGIKRTRFAEILAELVEPAQWLRIEQTLAPLL